MASNAKPGCGAYALWGFVVLGLYGWLGTAGLILAFVAGVIIWGVVIPRRKRNAQPEQS